MAVDEERIALLLDYENLALGAKDQLNGAAFDLGPVADALAERGRVVVRRAYGEWNSFESDARMLTRHHVELIEIPQRMGISRKNAADIKMVVDALEISFERDYISTFVIGTGDSDFTPLVHKLRERDKRVIGLGVGGSTSALLPPACDEFLFYDRLEGVEAGRKKASGRSRSRTKDDTGDDSGDDSEATARPRGDRPEDAERLVTRTLSGLQQNTGGAVQASMLKRAILRKDPTFSESDYGFRSFSELLANLENRAVIELSPGTAAGDPEVHFPDSAGGEEEQAFELLRTVVGGVEKRSGAPALSGLKDRMRKRDADFSEKRFGYSGFLQFAKAARTRGVIEMDWDDDADDYVVRVAG
ncbi:MAG: NYN domain-containing protein [Acidimicrobiia bacterium]